VSNNHLNRFGSGLSQLTFSSLLWTSTFEKICERASGGSVLHMSEHAFTEPIPASFASSEMIKWMTSNGSWMSLSSLS
jgi:hypothetical protein